MFHRCVYLVCGFWVGIVLATVSPALGQVPKTERLPNIVIVTIDTVRRDHVGCYGYARKTTPVIDRLASEGVLFENCVSPATWTLPSYMSIFTGVYPCVHDCTGFGRKLPKSIVTFPEKLKAKGYYCAGVVSNPFLGTPFGFGRGFDKYDDFSVFMDAELGMLAIDSNPDCGRVNEIVTGDKVTRQAILLLEQAKQSGKPIFLFAHYFDPHDSYIPPAPYNTRYDPDYKGKMDGRGVEMLRNNPPSKEDVDHLMALYDGEISYNDFQVGELLKKIDEICDPSQTLVIFVSDHGEGFGEHGTLLHGSRPYMEEVAVPMIFRWPGVLPKGKRVKEPVMSFDIAKTICELAGVKGMELMQCRSLWPGLVGSGLNADRKIFADRANGPPYQVAITEGSRRLHVKFSNEFNIHDAKYELYDLSADPHEQKDLLKASPTPPAAMRKAAEATWAECLEMRKYIQDKDQGKQPDLTEAERNRLKSLGYIGGAAVK